MITYEAVFNNVKNKGVYSISLVKSPAMVGTFIALSKNSKVEFKTVDAEQRILMGLVLEPNKPIYRNDKGEEYNIVFTEQTIKDLSQNFFKQGYQTNSTIEHSGERVEGLSFYESWIVEDSKIDKSANFGLSYPKGSWIATMKVDNDDVWNEYIKSGKVLGFSIDAFVTLKEINLKTSIEMAEEKKTFREQVKEILLEFGVGKKEVEIKLGSVKAIDGTAIVFDGETLEIGGAVWLEGEDEVKIPLPIGEIPLEDGRILVISEEGVIGSVNAKEEEAVEELANEGTPQSNDDIAQAIKSLLVKFQLDSDKKFEDMKAEFTKVNKELKDEVVELSKQPASKPIKSTPVQKSYTEMTNFEKLQFNRAN